MSTFVAIVSGGMDSITLAHDLADMNHDLHLVSFDYGQRHGRELDFAAATADALGASHDIVQMADMAPLLRSSLTGVADVPDGHYAEDNMKSTVVPNRNMIMLAIAGGIAVDRGADAVATGVHGGDHFIYPDCRPGFIAAASAALIVGNDGFAVPGFSGVIAPYLTWTKADIARRAAGMGLDLGAHSWSCYKGGAIHCGRCGTCVERAEAFHIAGVPDTTEYEDPDYWRTVTAP